MEAPYFGSEYLALSGLVCVQLLWYLTAHDLHQLVIGTLCIVASHRDIPFLYTNTISIPEKSEKSELEEIRSPSS